MKPEKTECFNCRSEGIIRRVSLEDVWFRNRTWNALLNAKLLMNAKKRQNLMEIKLHERK